MYKLAEEFRKKIYKMAKDLPKSNIKLNNTITQ